jgi:hypothetical protein
MLKNIAAHSKIKVLHILQEVGSICKTRNHLKECRWVRRFAWGHNSRSTYSLALACCFYLNVSWVMSRFFLQELQHEPQANLRLTYTEDALQAAYEHCEELFAQEFTVFMKKLGARELGEK